MSKVLSSFLLSIVFYCPMLAQNNCATTCMGNLGENIFINGDFGIGVPNVLATNPNIAPGYNYVINVPPNDGSYVITNSTTPWGSWATTNWINIKDNSTDPNGYMMVVNAAFTPSLFYEQKVDVCANTLYEMSVDVISLIEQSVAGNSIKSNVAFLIDGVDVCASGDIPHDGKWHTYRFSFTTSPSTTTVKLAFRNNAPGGYGNDLAIDNISFRACGPLLDIRDTSWYCAGTPLKIAANIQNSPYNTPAYQWQTSQDGGLTWNDIANANAVNLTVNAPQQNDLYRLLSANSTLNLDLPYCRALSATTRAYLEDLSQYAIGGTDTIVCNGAPGILVAGKFMDYAWSTGENTAQIAAPTPGWYAVTITTKENCTASDSLLVYRVDLFATTDVTPPICYGDSTGTASIVYLQGGTGGLVYALNSGPFGSITDFEGIPAGAHIAQIKDSLGCTVKMPFTLSNPPPLTVDIGSNRKILSCDTIAFQAVSNKSTLVYSWQPSDLLSCGNCPNPTMMPMRDTSVSILIVDELGCFTSDTVLVDVSPRLDVFAPNVFAPNSDGVNAFFTLFTSKSAVSVRKLAIYDRWGSLVFLRENILPGSNNLRWDGTTAAGKQAPEGVYIWMAEVLFTDNVSSIIKGDITLIR
jgi:gliding motility-associated-like protein